MKYKLGDIVYGIGESSGKPFKGVVDSITDDNMIGLLFTYLDGKPQDYSYSKDYTEEEIDDQVALYNSKLVQALL